MADAAAANRPIWVDLTSSDAAASRDYYSTLFGWNVEVNPDPQYGGYGLAKLGDDTIGGIGPAQSPEVPTAWNIYIGTLDADATAASAQSAGGTVLMPPFDVGDQGRMVVLRDPAGAVISAWQPRAMGAFRSGVTNAFGWAELNARGIDTAIPFYRSLFGWTAKQSPMGEGMPPYTEFHLDGQSVAGGTEMMPSVPPEVPSHWLAYFNVENVDAALTKAVSAGGREIAAPMDFPGGRFAIVNDPQGATFGLLSMRGA